jgi:hypothetical protein
VLIIGGTIKLEGKSLLSIKKEKDGSAEFYFDDSGSCETFLKFSPENFRRVADAALRFQLGKENEVEFEKKVKFNEHEGQVSAEDLQVLMHDQPVRFKVEDPGDDEAIPAILIQPTSGKNDIYSGLLIKMNEAQAAELVKRLGMFLEAAKLRRDASKTKMIAAPARTKRTRAFASA